MAHEVERRGREVDALVSGTQTASPHRAGKLQGSGDSRLLSDALVISSAPLSGAIRWGSYTYLSIMVSPACCEIHGRQNSQYQWYFPYFPLHSDYAHCMRSGHVSAYVIY